MNQTDPPESSKPSSESSDRPPIWQSKELLAGSDEVLIQHGDDVYRLRRTRSGKLILYK